MEVSFLARCLVWNYSIEDMCAQLSIILVSENDSPTNNTLLKKLKK